MSQIRKNISYNVMLSIGQLLFPVFSIPYISRVLTPDGLGHVNFVDSLSFYFTALAGMGVASYGIREIAKYINDDRKVEQIVSELFSFHVLATMFFVLLYLLVAFFLYAKISNIYLVFFSVIFIAANSLTCEWYFIGTQKFKYIAFRNLFTRLIGLICIYLFVKKPDDFFIYYGIMIGCLLFNIFWNIQLLFKEVKVSLVVPDLKNIFSKTKNMYFVGILFSISLMLDNVLLGLVASTAAVSFYTLSSKVVRMAGTIVTDAFYVLYPTTVSVMHEGGKERKDEFVYNSFQWICIVTFPLCFGIYLFSKTFTCLYFGVQFQQVAIGLKILSIYPLIKSFSLYFDKQFLFPANKENLVLRSLIVSMVVFIPANLLLSYFFSFAGTCFALIISETILLLFNYYYAMKYCGHIKLVNYKNLYQIICGTLLFIPVTHFFRLFLKSDLLYLIASFAISGSIFILFLFGIGNCYIRSIVLFWKKEKKSSSRGNR